LRKSVDLEVHCWGIPRTEPKVIAHEPWDVLAQPKPESAALQAISIDLAMAAGAKGRQLVHSHTWYANLGGDLAKRMWGVPHGVDPDRPYALFVGRITRQKGVAQLLHAAPSIDRAYQLVMCAGAPDTPEIAREVDDLRRRVEAERGRLVWIEEMLPRAEVIKLYSGAAVFICPSVYEPFGIVNLEAMACETAVVATNVGGIPEIVV